VGIPDTGPGEYPARNPELPGSFWNCSSAADHDQEDLVDTSLERATMTPPCEV
jgi:hypothetical protein